jgi:uncharacterized membrane protein YphA (DoxX/SURF4 family)
MFVILVVVAIATALALTASARLKLTRDPRAVEQISTALDVPLGWFPALAAAELAGAVGVLVGLAVTPIGIAASVGLIVYFVLAIAFHLRAHDRNFAPPAIPLVLAVAYLVLRLASS